MAQAWHRSPAEKPGQPERARLRRAAKHEWSFLEGWSERPHALVASPQAVWKRADPFTTYEPASRKRAFGPHVDFATLGGKRERPEFDPEAGKFADKYGLLGLFYEYCSDPIFPEGKPYVSPNAVINKEGRLCPVDPAKEGKSHLEELLYKRNGPSPRTGKKMRFSTMLALPEELAFYPTHELAALPGVAAVGGPLGGEVLHWTDVEEEYGAFAVRDKYATRGVSIISTRERLSLWEMEARDFALRVDKGRSLSLDGLNERIAGASPYATLTTEGEVDRGWRCRSLLQAMYLMLYLDLTGGRSIRRCRKSGCGNYYREGSQPTSYCSERCASAASTRMRRGQKP